MDKILEILINNTERLLDQQDKMNDKIHEIDKTLGRLTDTVVLHEQRSTNLESIQKNCKTECDARIDSTELVAISAQHAFSEIQDWFKTALWIIGAVVGILGLLSSVAQIYSVWF
jgi:2-phospho-L-lactate transferase/gluconeogenesis factor (CofD/UPF0052 family)